MTSPDLGPDRRASQGFRSEWAALAALALCLLLFKLSVAVRGSGFEGDDLSITVGVWELAHPDLQVGSAAHTHRYAAFPLYYALLGGLQRLGDLSPTGIGEAGVTLSAVCGTLNCVLTVLLALRLTGSRSLAAWTAAVWLCLPVTLLVENHLNAVTPSLTVLLVATHLALGRPATPGSSGPSRPDWGVWVSAALVPCAGLLRPDCFGLAFVPLALRYASGRALPLRLVAGWVAVFAAALAVGYIATGTTPLKALHEIISHRGDALRRGLELPNVVVTASPQIWLCVPLGCWAWWRRPGASLRQRGLVTAVLIAWIIVPILANAPNLSSPRYLYTLAPALALSAAAVWGRRPWAGLDAPSSQPLRLLLGAALLASVWFVGLDPATGLPSVRQCAMINTDDGYYPVSGLYGALRRAQEEDFRQMRMTAQVLMADIRRLGRPATVVAGWPVIYELELQYDEARHAGTRQPATRFSTWEEPARWRPEEGSLYALLQGRAVVQQFVRRWGASQYAWRLLPWAGDLVFRATERGQPSEAFWLWLAAPSASPEDPHIAVRPLPRPASAEEEPLQWPVRAGRLQHVVVLAERGLPPPPVVYWPLDRPADGGLALAARAVPEAAWAPPGTTSNLPGRVWAYDIPASWTERLVLEGLSQPGIRQVMLATGSRPQTGGLLRLKGLRRGRAH